ncbi:5-aminolevulinate synthase [Nemania sp. FL0916]|nr:5-aminolevulinate synthase [Nemania sp. FL0916]
MGEINDGDTRSPIGTFVKRILDQRVQPRSVEDMPIFYQNLEEALDVRRNAHNFYSLVQNNWRTSNAVDLCSGDILSLGASEERRAEFLAELRRNPDFTLGSSGVRLMDGHYSYLEDAEKSIATFHGAEAGLIVGSAYEANVAVWTAIPRPGDVILFDALVHASSHEGIRQSLAIEKVEFAHNDIESFRSSVLEIAASQPLIRQGKRSIIVAVESIYSMDGDVCPLRELVEAADDVLGCDGNIQFVVDEAHSIGVIGPKGAGLVCELGLEKEIAVVVHSYGKALGATGAVILGNKTIIDTLVNFGRSITYTTSPSFAFVAAIKSGYALLATAQTRDAQGRIQDLARLFFRSISSHSLWPAAKGQGLLYIPLLDRWEERPFLTHILPISTNQKYTWWLYFHLLSSSYCVFPVDYPIVPIGQSRLRIILHASNTDEQITDFVRLVFEWVDEMIQIEEGRTPDRVSKAAREVYAWMEKEQLTGWGKV